MLEPGDEFDGIRIDTGTSEAVPLTAFCQRVVEKTDTTFSNCRVPPASKLAIGDILGEADSTLQTLDWTALTWEFSVDGHAVDLDAFGIYRAIQPTFSPSPSPYRETFKQVKAWDVVLVNPTLGDHTITGRAFNSDKSYLRIVNFTLEG